MAEQDDAHLGLQGILEGRRRVVPVEKQRVFEEDGACRRQGQRHLGDDELGEEDRHGPGFEPHDGAGQAHGLLAAIHQQPQGPARQKDEELGGVAQAIMSHGVVGEDEPGNMVDEDREERESPPEIDFVWAAHVRFQSQVGLLRPSRLAP